MNAVAIELEPTLTYAARECEWEPVSLTDGVLTVRLRKTRNGREECDTYAVQEQHTDVPGVREFLVECVTHDTPDVYGVAIGPGVDVCTCTAGLVTRHTHKHSCRHRDALRALLAAGEFQTSNQESRS